MCELANHLNEIKQIISILYEITNKTLDFSHLDPTTKYKFIHIDYNQRYNSNIRYPPILISNDFSNLYTNVGIMDTHIKLTDKHIISKLKELLMLEYYNHSYYSTHMAPYRPLENYYSPIRIMDEWIK